MTGYYLPGKIKQLFSGGFYTNIILQPIAFLLQG
jgi:hypothetical protein